MFDTILSRMRGAHKAPGAPLLRERKEPSFAVRNKPAFEARPVGALDSVNPVTVVFPSRTRHHRLEAEAVLFVIFYEDFAKCVRFIQLHGKMKADFGDQIPMPTVDVHNRKLDDIVSISAIDAVAFLAAVRNPIIMEAIPDDQQPRYSVAPVRPSVRIDQYQAGPAVPTAAADPRRLIPHGALAQYEGEYLAQGMLPFIGPKGEKGKPSFCVLLRDQHGKELRCYGSDLDRAMRDSNALPGDVVRLVKFPRMAVVVGNRTVNKNIWTADVIAKP